jgi:hypothetical protein
MNQNLTADAALPGVVVRPLSRRADQRGWLLELFREDELPAGFRPVMAYVSEPVGAGGLRVVRDERRLRVGTRAVDRRHQHGHTANPNQGCGQSAPQRRNGATHRKSLRLTQ